MRERLGRRLWLWIALGLFFVVVIVSLLLFPDWRSEALTWLVLLGLAAAGVADFVANMRSVVEPEATAEPQASVFSKTTAKKRGVTVRESVGGDVTTGNKTEHHYYYSASAPQRNTPSTALPRQAVFFGREKELADIARFIEPEDRGWGVLIDGPGGIGKTALAIEAGHKAPARFFKRKLFLSAKMRELTPRGERPLADFQLPNYLELLKELALALGGGWASPNYP